MDVCGYGVCLAFIVQVISYVIIVLVIRSKKPIGIIFHVKHVL